MRQKLYQYIVSVVASLQQDTLTDEQAARLESTLHDLSARLPSSTEAVDMGTIASTDTHACWQLLINGVCTVIEGERCWRLIGYGATISPDPQCEIAIHICGNFGPDDGNLKKTLCDKYHAALTQEIDI